MVQLLIDHLGSNYNIDIIKESIMTARYSPIAPIHLLGQLFDREVATGEPVLGNYLLLLAHDVLAHPIQYENLIIELRERYEGEVFLIMDNSVVELGHPMPIDDVIEAACVVEASCIMTPDVLGNFSKTQYLVESARHELLKCGFPLMRVPQGKDLAEILLCIEWLDEMLPCSFPTENYWAVPRWVTNTLGSRAPVIHYLSRELRQPKIHLLGMSKDLNDDMVCTAFPYVMGIDSANPMVMGVWNIPINSSDPYAHWDRGEYWNLEALNETMISNVEYMHTHVGT